MIKRVISDTVKYPIKLWTEEIEETAEEQLRRLGRLPFIFKHVAVMPDCHAGKGSTIGSVIATKGAIIPAAVGVDVGCGMSAVKLDGLDPNSLGELSKLRAVIENSVPVGFSGFEESKTCFNPKIESHANLGRGAEQVISRASIYQAKSNKIERGIGKMLTQLGTLGGGNHFIEICVSVKNEVWLMFHSGSRGVGNLIAQFHIQNAKKLMERMFIDLPDPDLSYFPEDTKEFQHYLADMMWAQEFAFLNRRVMQENILKSLSKILKFKKHWSKFEFIDCHHNYVSRENHFGENVLITRKGAVNASSGKLAIIPGSMGTKSYIVEGLGNSQSFNSCSHGAGRKMSRNEAKRVFTVHDFADQTAGVECRKDDAVLDEIPGAYKDIDEVMENQKDLVKIVEELKQIVCVKG